jgi:hypothetical protein
MDRNATILGVTEPLSLGHTVLLLNTDHLKMSLTVQILLSNMVMANQVHTQMFLNSMEIVNRVHIQMAHKETFLIPMARFLNNQTVMHQMEMLRLVRIPVMLAPEAPTATVQVQLTSTTRMVRKILKIPKTFRTLNSLRILSTLKPSRTIKMPPRSLPRTKTDGLIKVIMLPKKILVRRSRMSVAIVVTRIAL